MPRYIDADNAKEIYLSKSAGEQLDKVPTADVQEVKHGKWIFNGVLYKCSECNSSEIYNDYKYCGYCGAKMDGDTND